MVQAQVQPNAYDLSQETTERINAAATAHWNDWKENATAEQKAAYNQRYKKINSDPEFRNTTMANLTEDWNGSDADGDGYLNLEEFKVWVTKAKDREIAAGCYVRPDPDQARTTEFYNVANTITEGEGIVLMDFFTYMGPWMAKYLEIANESVSQALLDQINAYATTRYNEFVANATAEQQAVYWEFMAKVKDPLNCEFRDNHTAKLKAAWDAADANQDGLLSLDEFRVWGEGQKRLRREDCFYVDADSRVEETYAMLNAITEGTDGITLDDFYLLMGPYSQKWADLKASGAGQ